MKLAWTGIFGKELQAMAISQDEFLRFAGVKQHSQFQNFLEKIMFDKERREQFYKDCIAADPQCIDDDTFRGYFEDYAAERKSNQQDFTPKGLARLVTELTDKKKNSVWTAYDPAAGTGSLILEKWKKERNKVLPWDYQPHNYFYMAQELSDTAIPYLVHNLAMRGINAVVVHGDTLEGTANQAYFVQNAKDDALAFSSINVLPHTDAIADFLQIKEWTADPIEHIEDSLEDVKYFNFKEVQ